MNKENLEILAFRIEKAEHKSTLDDDGKNGFNLNNEYFDCGAPACIAGWAVHLATGKENIKELYYSKDGYNTPTSFSSLAKNFMGIDEATYRNLCYPFTTFERADMSFEDVSPEDAAKVIRNLAETGEVDWSIVGIKEIEDDE